jgi:beta-mannosidase
MSRRPPLPLDGPGWTIKGYLDQDWRMRRAYAPDTRDVHGWVPARVPGSVLDDLVRAGEVPDPLVDLNSRAVEWVPARTWVYRREVSLDPDGGPVELQFDGIDHAARVFVNGIEVGHHAGAFTPAAFDVTAAVKEGANLIAVVVAAAPDGQSQFGDTSRVRTGKSRMTYGWDFCPRVVHLGIWDDARLAFPAPVRIADLFVRSRVGDGGRPASLTWRLEAAAHRRGPASVAVDLLRDGAVVAGTEREVELTASTTVIDGELTVAEPELWWPNGYGPQPLYQVRARLVAPDGEDTAEVTTAFRSVELVANDGAPKDARGYTVVVNGERIYVQGWNWAPASIHHGVDDTDRLAHLVGLAARADVNLLRVWGGGLIEKRAFYDECDRRGIMVWQEFPLSSSLQGSVPSDDPDYVATIARDARQIVRRRRNHPSLVIWCGGNELEAPGGHPADGTEPVLAALRDVVSELDPDRAWLPTSPTGPYATYTLEALDADPDGQHDVHGPWEHQGLTAQRTLYDRATSLLHSEFGVEGMSNVETIEAYVAEHHRWPADRSNPHVRHRGDFWVNTPLLEEVFGPFDDLTTLVAASQFLQADGLRYAVEANRRRQWRNSGSIPWQLAEPFPNVFCTSAVDYSGRPKAAYHAVADAYAPVLVSAQLPAQAWAGHSHVDAAVWVSSRREALPGARVRATLVGSRGETLHEAWFDAPVIAGGSVEVTRVRWPVPDVPLFWLDLQLHGGGERRSHNRYLCSSGTDLAAMRELPAPALEAEWTDPGRRLTVRNTGPQVAVGVRVCDARPAGAPGYTWVGGGNRTLFPGEVHTVDVGWTGVAADQRRLAVDAWNAEVKLHV